MKMDDELCKTCENDAEECRQNYDASTGQSEYLTCIEGNGIFRVDNRHCEYCIGPKMELCEEEDQ